MPRPYRPDTLEYIYLKHKKRMTNPERSVEEKWRKNAEYLARSLKKQNYQDIERHFSDLVASAIQETLQAERQKREEMVGEVRLLLAKHYRGEDFDDVGFLEDLRKITQPNNPK